MTLAGNHLKDMLGPAWAKHSDTRSLWGHKNVPVMQCHCEVKIDVVSFLMSLL